MAGSPVDRIGGGYTTDPSQHQLLQDGFRHALDLIVHGDPQILAATGNTLRLGLEATAFAAVAGLPLGCLLAIGRFRGRRPLLAVATSLARIPAVLIGVFAALLFRVESPWGGGPLAGLDVNPHLGAVNGLYMVQAMLVFPIIVALTATALQTVAPGLVDQARAYGASGWRCGLLALREARAGVLAGMLLALAVAMTTIGAIATYTGIGAGSDGPSYLATGTLTAYTSGQARQGFDPTFRGQPLAIAYATILIALFLICAIAATALQGGANGRIAGGQLLRDMRPRARWAAR